MKTSVHPGYVANAYALAQKMSFNAPVTGEKAAEEGNSFVDILQATVGSARDSGRRADQLSTKVARGQSTDLVDVVTAVAESEAALESLVAVRDRVVAAYEEIMRMPI